MFLLHIATYTASWLVKKLEEVSYKMMLTLLLIFCTTSTIHWGCHGETVINVANGVYSAKAESDGLHLSSTSTFKPIAALTLSVHFTSSFSVFVNYQITVDGTTQFWTKLQITRDDDGLTNAGSLVHYHTQNYKTATGYWMDNLEAGHYTFEVHYKSTSSIFISSSADYQTAILQAMWFSSAHAVSDGVKCYPTPTPINSYSVLSPIKDLKVNLVVPPNGRVVIAGYQLSVYSPHRWFTTRIHKNYQQLLSTIMSQGDDYYYSLNSLWMDYQDDAEYEFGVTYYNSYSSCYFEDCRDNYRGNKNLYAMYLPSVCHRLATIRPTSSLSLSSTAWKTTDLSYSFRLYQDEHIIVRYQYTVQVNTYIVTRLVIDSVPIKHTASIAYDNRMVGNSGMWQGILSSGIHTIAVEHRSGRTYTHYPASGYYYNTRAMDIIRCY